MLGTVPVPYPCHAKFYWDFSSTNFAQSPEPLPTRALRTLWSAVMTQHLFSQNLPILKRVCPITVNNNLFTSWNVRFWITFQNTHTFPGADITKHSDITSNIHNIFTLLYSSGSAKQQQTEKRKGVRKIIQNPFDILKSKKKSDENKGTVTTQNGISM